MKKSFALLVLLAACGGATPSYDYTKEPDPRKSEYVIGVSDGLEINVWKNPELTTKATVRPDGTITMPLIGDLVAAGKTPSRLKAEIALQLANFVRDESAVVTVAVASVQSYRYTVSGNVEKPGVFTSPSYVTVLEAIEQAGGPNRFASPSGTVIVRTDADGRARRIPIPYRDVRSGKRPDANLTVLAGDTIYIP